MSVMYVRSRCTAHIPANRITTLMTTAAAVKVMQKKSFCADPLSHADKVVTAAITASGNVDRVSF